MKNASSTSINLLEQGPNGIAFGYSGSFWYVANSGSSYGATFSTPFLQNTWYHFAITRTFPGGTPTIGFWINGVWQGSSTITYNWTGRSPDANGAYAPNLAVGQGVTALNGYMQEYRISNIARYTNGVNFTPKQHHLLMTLTHCY